jgi:Flp pilus assembly protein TadG
MILPMLDKLMGSLDRFWRRGNSGAAAVELAITAPFMIVLALGIADYGNLMNASASLEGATRAVAEFARNSPQCAAGGLSSSSCITGINNLVSTLQTNNSSLSSATFAPSAALSTAANYCTCTDGTVISCSTGTCSVGNPPDTRVLQYIQITGTQNINPVVSYGTYTSAKSLNAQTTTRIQ